MKYLGTKKHPVYGKINIIEFELSDFDFSQDFESLSSSKKADFLSFIVIPMLPHDKNDPMYKHVIKRWLEFRKSQQDNTPEK